MNKHISNITAFVCLLCVSTLAQAAIITHHVTITGDADESGSVVFTWDDTVVSNGNGIETGELLSLSITISGSNVVGGTTTFSLADCDNAFDGGAPDFYLQNTPKFNEDINFWCDNGVNSIFGVNYFTAALNNPPVLEPTKTQSNTSKYGSTTQKARAPGTIYFASTVYNAPTLSQWTLILLALVLGGIGYTAAIKTKKS